MSVLPVWQALHAYVAGTRVTKVTADGTVWQVSTAGTSGAAEPTWPVNEPWTVTDGTVTWGLATSFRMNAVSGLLTTLTTFRTANPTLLVGLSASRPKSMNNLSMPGAFVDGRDEAISIAHNIRNRTLGGLSLVLVDVTPDNVEAEARMDALVDGVVDALTAAYHAAGGKSILGPTSVAEEAIEEGWLGNRITLGESSIQEGRT